MLLFQIGSPEPTFHKGNSCINVPIPAIIIALWIIIAVSLAVRPHADATIITGVILATNMAKICCNPNGKALNKVIYELAMYTLNTNKDYDEKTREFLKKLFKEKLNIE